MKKRIDIYVRAEKDPLWHNVKVDVTRDFDAALTTVAAKLDLKSGSFHLMLVGGGLIERANVLTPGDKLVAHLNEAEIEDQHNPKLD